MKKNKNLIYIALLGAAAIAFFVLKKKKDTNKDEKLTNTDVNDTTTTPDIIKDVKNAIDTTPNPLETVIKVGKKIINKKTKQPVQQNKNVVKQVNTKYGGISQTAVNEILRISKQNLLQLNVVYLLPLQQQYIDLKFGPKTYDKFFNHGGKNLLDNNKTTPKTKKQPKKKIPKKRVKGFDDISVLY